MARELDKAQELALAESRRTSKASSAPKGSSLWNDLEQAWEKFEPLLEATPDVSAEDSMKLLANAEDMIYDKGKDFLQGLDVVTLTRSMKQEFEQNEDGKWRAEYDYVVNHEAIGVYEKTEAIKRKFEKLGLPKGAINKRDVGHEGMTLDDFCEHNDAEKAELTKAEVAALRLYTGPAYTALNSALRSKAIEQWATTIACCYSGILKLQFLSENKERVYRGVREGDVKLPDKMLKGEFMCGVELGFASTTKSPEIALQYTGKGAGSIFAIDYSASTRGASLRFLSQFPHEEEYLFPPKTMIEVKAHSMRGNKRLLLATMSVSTKCPDTSAISDPDTVPGGGDDAIPVTPAERTKTLKAHRQGLKAAEQPDVAALKLVKKAIEQSTSDDAKLVELEAALKKAMEQEEYDKYEELEKEKNELEAKWKSGDLAQAIRAAALKINVDEI